MKEAITKDSAHKIHLSIAEAGKLHALKNNHKEALRHYREAMRLAVSSKAPEVFFRHYTQCVLESLELTESYAEVIQFCKDADKHYTQLKANSNLHRRDHGSILERLGIAQLKQGDQAAGKATLEQACQVAGEGTLPLTQEVLGWLQRGFAVDKARLLQSQRRRHYFVVRSDNVDAKQAQPLPAGKVAPELGKLIS
jgi:tetratricopeptide (TPR) repeat protein